MAIAHQHTAQGYYIGPIEDYGRLPGHATYDKPEVKDGFIPRFVNGKWTQVENHKGKTGYVNGEPFTVKDYGPLPAGWSDTPPPPTPEEQAEAAKAQFTAAIQQYLDGFAKTRNYDNILSACTYATSTVGKFMIEGQYCVEMRDAVWATGYAIMDAVLAGQRPMPTVDEVFAELPVLAWPE